MTKGNIGFLYFRDYYTKGQLPNNGLKEFSYEFVISGNKKLKAANKELLAAKNMNIGKQQLQTIGSLPGLHTTKPYIVKYPGLLTGIGITHETGATGELKLGLHFDYAAGCPVIYGSSVKGVLRKAFTDYPGTVADEIRQLTGTEASEEQIQLLEQEIFSGLRSGKPLSIYNRDTFFDAIIIKANTKGRILDNDSITPHSSPIKNPIPVAFIKIAAGVQVQFNFKLHNSQVIVTLTANTKKQLLERLLEISGIGAKTNVGYGQFKQS